MDQGARDANAESHRAAVLSSLRAFEKAAASPPASHRANWLGAPQMFNLNMACLAVSEAFGIPYLVGSALTHRDHRDVDVRCILDDTRFAAIFGTQVGAVYNARLALLNASISLWLSQHSGLPVDFQFQQQTDANAKFDGARHAIGLFVSDSAASEGGESDGK